KQQFVRPAVVGIVSGAIASMSGRDYQSLVFGYEVPKWAFYGALGFGSSFVSETLHQWILPMLPQSQQAVTAENALLSPAIHAAVNLTALSIVYPSVIKEEGWMERRHWFRCRIHWRLQFQQFPQRHAMDAVNN